MRILHTADLHLGGRFHDQDRSRDEEDALDQVCDLCDRERVDAVLIAGDIFDTANPGAEEQHRYYRFLARLAFEVRVGSVVVIGGNHDSGLRLDGPRELLETLRVHVVGRLPREADAGSCVFPLRDRMGRERAVCAAVPHLRDGDLRLAPGGEAVGEAHRRYSQALALRYGGIREAAGTGLPVVVTGHCFAAGGRPEGDERPVQVGNLGLVRAEDLAGGASYLALGHLHRPQSLGGRAHWRYCGSLLPAGFDEAAQRRQVVLAEIPEGGGAAEVQAVELAPFRRYRRLSGAEADLRRILEELDPPGTGDATPWCELTVGLEGPRPGIAEELGELARTRGWEAVSVRRQATGGGTREGWTEEALSLEALGPEEVFRRCHEASFDAPPDAELLVEFRSLLEAVTSPAVEA